MFNCKNDQLEIQSCIVLDYVDESTFCAVFPSKTPRLEKTLGFPSLEKLN